MDPALSAEEKKLSFVSIWFSFAFALFLLNRWWRIPLSYLSQNVQRKYLSYIFPPMSRENKRLTVDLIPHFGAWQAVVLVFVGLVGSQSVYLFVHWI